jgi:hypothetical protein
MFLRVLKRASVEGLASVAAVSCRNLAVLNLSANVSVLEDSLLSWVGWVSMVLLAEFSVLDVDGKLLLLSDGVAKLVELVSCESSMLSSMLSSELTLFLLYMLCI